MARTTGKTAKNNLGAAFAAEDDDAPALVPAPEKRIKIMLEENDNIPPTGQFISHNGRTFVLKPGEEALVPECVIDVLNHAVQASPQLDPATQQVIGYRQKLRFPYRVMA